MESGNGDDFLEFSDFSLFYILPNEILVSIFSYLSLKDLCMTVPIVCKAWFVISSDNTLWKSLYARQWPNVPKALRDGTAANQLRETETRIVISPSKWMKIQGLTPSKPASKPRPTPTQRKSNPSDKPRLAISLPNAKSESHAVMRKDKARLGGRGLHAKESEKRKGKAKVLVIQDTQSDGEDSGDDSGDDGGEEFDPVVADRHSSSSEESDRMSPRMLRRAKGNQASALTSDMSFLKTSDSGASTEENLSSTESISDIEDDMTTGLGNTGESSGTWTETPESYGSLDRELYGSDALADEGNNSDEDEDGDRDRGCNINWRKHFAERVVREQNWRGSPKSVATLKGHTLAVMSVIFEGDAIASCSLDGTIKTWDMKQKRCTWTYTGHTDWVNYIDYDLITRDMSKIVSCSYDTSIKLWDTKQRTCSRTLWGHQNIVWAVQLAGNRIISCSSDATIRIWDVEVGACLETLTGHDSAVYCCQYDPSRNVLVTGSMDRTIRLWDLASTGDSKGGCFGVLQGHSDRLCCLQFNRESTVVSGSRDSTIRLWDIRLIQGGGGNKSKDTNAKWSVQGGCYRVLRGHEGRVCCLQFDEDMIVSGSDDNTVKIWSMHEPRPWDSRTTTGFFKGPSGSVGGDRDGSKGEESYCVNTLTAHDYWVNSLKFSDGLLVSGAADDTIKLWDFAKKPSGCEASSRMNRSASAKRAMNGSKSGTGVGSAFNGMFVNPAESVLLPFTLANSVSSRCIVS